MLGPVHGQIEARRDGEALVHSERDDEETISVVRQFHRATQDDVNNLLANGVMSASEIVRGVLLSRAEPLQVEELAVHDIAHLIHHRGLKVDGDHVRNVASPAPVSEKNVLSASSPPSTVLPLKTHIR